MTRRIRSLVGRFALAVVVVVTVVGGTGRAAEAAPPITTFVSPSEGEVLTVPNPAVVGEVRMANGLLLEDVRVEVVSKWDRPGASTTVPAFALASQSFNFTPTLRYNGPYQVIVTAVGTDISLDIRTDTAVTSRTFSLAVPPAVPTGVSVTVDPQARSTRVTWNANSEPDIIGYEVRRRSAREGYKAVGVTASPNFLDEGTRARGGEYGYQVVALRAGATADQGVTSGSSETVVVVVPDAVRGTPPTPPTAPVSAATVPPTTVELSGFPTLIPGATEGDEPDVVGGEPAAGSEPLDGSAIAVGERRPDPRRSLAFVAAGLLVAVLAAQARWLKRQVDRTGAPGTGAP